MFEISDPEISLFNTFSSIKKKIIKNKDFAYCLSEVQKLEPPLESNQKSVLDVGNQRPKKIHFRYLLLNVFSFENSKLVEHSSSSFGRLKIFSVKRKLDSRHYQI